FATVALDTEGDSLHCYFEKLCLIQISVEGNDLLIDSLRPLDFSEFNDLLKNRKLVFHGCDYDLRMLRRGINFVPREVIDTYIAAKLAGAKEVGLAFLVKEFFGIDLPKSSQKANWARRPLTPKMMEYAVNDTAYLLELAVRLIEDLKRKSRYEWFEESCRRAVTAAAEDREKDLDKIWKVPGSAGLGGKSLAVLKSVWRWRECEAQKSDRPAFQVLHNQELIELAKLAGQDKVSIPTSVQGSRRKRLQEVIEYAVQLPESEWPESARKGKARPTAGQEQFFDELRKRRDRVANEYELDPGIIAPRQALERISREPSVVDAVLMSWQKQLLGL
ncbi:MAG: HRDC domain-containing protein, partial [Verrucomicrobia bacterium]|nr:HRDC domain-containing protein [Verrucomicrobiota bacterium]